MNRYRGSFANTKVFVHPDIPPERLRGALSKYAKDVAPDWVMLLADTSLRGNGKAGLLLTRTTIHAHDILLDRQLSLAVIEDVDSSRTMLRVNGTDLVNKGMLGDAAGPLADLLRELSPQGRPTTHGAIDRLSAPPTTGTTPVDNAETGGNKRTPSIWRGIGFLLVGLVALGWTAYWIANMAAADECVVSGSEIECVSSSGRYEMTWTLDWYAFLGLALAGLGSLVVGIAQIIRGVGRLRRRRPRPGDRAIMVGLLMVVGWFSGAVVLNYFFPVEADTAPGFQGGAEIARYALEVVLPASVIILIVGVVRRYRSRPPSAHDGHPTPQDSLGDPKGVA